MENTHINNQREKTLQKKAIWYNRAPISHGNGEETFSG